MWVVSRILMFFCYCILRIFMGHLFRIRSDFEKNIFCNRLHKLRKWAILVAVEEKEGRAVCFDGFPVFLIFSERGPRRRLFVRLSRKAVRSGGLIFLPEFFKEGF